MDSDTEGSFDDNDDYDTLFDCGPLSNECKNEVVGIESIYKCFIRRYSACPAFFSGYLFDALQTALHSTTIKDRRPVLVYIHNDKSTTTKIFCSKIFCSEIIIDYLINNYIVWPWDITLKSNQNILIDIWNNLFSDQLMNFFSIEQCPILIGIMRRSAGEDGWEYTSEYQFQLLMNSDTLICNEEKANREIVLRQLISFKEKCDQNEQAALFDFITKTGLNWEIILKITEYLTLNDAIKAFSGRILALLCQYKSKLQLSDPSVALKNMIFRKIKPEQIVSLRLNTSLYSTESQSASLAGLTDVISLSLLNFASPHLINIYEEYFPRLIRLSLWYDNEVNFKILCTIINLNHRPIKRLEIHCGGVTCTHAHWDLFDMRCGPQLTVEYFLIDIGQSSLPSRNECYEQHRSCFLMTIIYFIKNLVNIRHVRLITNRYNLDELLNAYQWKTLINACVRLKTITMEVCGNTLEKEELLQRAIEVQKIINTNEQTVKFRMVFR